MNIAIRYFTKSKKGNTLKLANFISEKLNIEAKTVEEDLNEDVDILFLVNAMYAANIDKEVKVFLEKNKNHIKCLYNVCSSASGKSTYKVVKKVCDKEGIKIAEDEYHTVASWIFINKDRPNEEDFKRLEDFIKKVTE
jgi:flavodoxin